MSWSHMDTGSIIPNTDMFGALIWGPVSGLTAQTVIGFIPMITNGCGSQIMNGDGGLFTMAAGFTMIIMAGSGCRATNGRPHGFAGAPAVIIMAGRRWDRNSASV